jgi:copper transport protein
VRRKGSAALLVAAALLGLTGRAQAHALVKSSAPSDGQLLDASPSEVIVSFTEPPDPTLSLLHVLDSSGKEVESGKSALVVGDRFSLRVPVTRLPNGVYTVSWRAISLADGHVTAGSFTFGVGVSAVTPAEPPKEAAVARPTAASVLGRWGLLWGLILLLGAAMSSTLIFRGKLTGARVGVPAAWILAIVGLTIFAFAEASSVGVSIGKLLSSGRGRLLDYQALGLGLTLVPAALFAIRGGRLAGLLLGVGAAATMLVHSIASHAGGAASGELAKVGSQWVHILAVGAWVGGLPWLILGTRADLGGTRVLAVRRFSLMATFAIAIVALTGALRAIDEVGSFNKLTTTDFGKTLIVKVVLFGGLGLLGAVNRFRLVPALSRASRAMSRLRGTVSAEIVFGIAIVAVTALLSGFVPPSLIVETKPRTPQRLVATGSDFAKSARVRLVITPGFVGGNKFELTAADFDTGKPLDASRISLSFSQPDRPEIRPSVVELQKSGDRWTASGTALARRGSWTVTALVQQPATSVQVSLRVSPRIPPQRIATVRVEGQPTIYTISLTGGHTMQVYFDPDKPGPNQMHVTFFDPKGGELPADSAQVTAVPPKGTEADLPTRRFGPGHFVSDVTLAKGRWRFEISAATSAGPVEATLPVSY